MGASNNNASVKLDFKPKQYSVLFALKGRGHSLFVNLPKEDLSELVSACLTYLNTQDWIYLFYQNISEEYTSLERQAAGEVMNIIRSNSLSDVEDLYYDLKNAASDGVSSPFSFYLIFDANSYGTSHLEKRANRMYYEDTKKE